MTEYDAVLFDSDGVLVQPPAHETKVSAAREAFRAVGVSDVDREHLTDVVSGPSVEQVREICAAYDLDVEAFWTAREHHDERSQFDQFEAGARDRYDDVVAVEGLDYPCGVVSNNHHSTIEFVLEQFDLHGAFDTYYGREKTVESLDRKKPNTHYLDRALADLDAESALYVGDSDGDVVAADRAGLDSAFVRRPHSADTTLSLTPTYDVDSLHDVAALLTE
ncbi:MAG: HAD family hydrolase [Halopenitus sp.]